MQYLVWVRGPTGRSGLLGGSAPGLLRELVLGGRGFLGGMAGTEGFCKSSFGSLSGLSLRKHKEDRENSPPPDRGRGRGPATASLSGARTMMASGGAGVSGANGVPIGVGLPETHRQLH